MRRNAGFTLIETVIFIVVVAVALAGIASLFTTNIKNSASPLIRERTIMLAQAYMDEIISKRWHELTPVGGGCLDTDPGSANDSCTLYCATITSQAQCDRSKCRYDSGTSSCVAAESTATAVDESAEVGTRSLWDDIDDYDGYNPNPPQDIHGNNITEYTDYSVNVNVTTPSANWHGIPKEDVRRISVTVNNPLGDSMTLISYRVNF